MGPRKQVAIIGAGPAGITAAMQLKRYGIPFTLLEKERVGGLLKNANLVENYPGFPSGVSGPKLVDLIAKQMARIGVQIKQEEVFRVVINAIDKTFTLSTNNTEYTTPHVIIASGTRPKPIPIQIPPQANDMVFSEVYSLRNVQNKKIVIIGAGDAAFDYALNLVKKRNSVTILNRGQDVKCLKLLWERAMADPGIRYLEQTPIGRVEVGEAASRLVVRAEANQVFEADYLLFAIGRIPNTAFLSEEMRRRNFPGLYFVGDVINGPFRQAAIAAGDGLRAAMQIHALFRSEA